MSMSVTYMMNFHVNNPSRLLCHITPLFTERRSLEIASEFQFYFDFRNLRGRGRYKLSHRSVFGDNVSQEPVSFKFR